jgi:hypothetical protein
MDGCLSGFPFQTVFDPALDDHPKVTLTLFPAPHRIFYLFSLPIKYILSTSPVAPTSPHRDEEIEPGSG